MNTKKQQPKKFVKKDFKVEIKKKFGSVTGLKNHLKKIAKNEYGCDYAEITIYGCKIIYTSNPNCWASFIVRVKHVGFSSGLALGKSSITKAGKIRGCFGSNYILTL